MSILMHHHVLMATFGRRLWKYILGSDPCDMPMIFVKLGFNLVYRHSQKLAKSVLFMIRRGIRKAPRRLYPAIAAARNISAFLQRQSSSTTGHPLHSFCRHHCRSYNQSLLSYLTPVLTYPTMQRTNHAYHHDGQTTALQSTILALRTMESLTDDDKVLNKLGKDDDKVVIVDSTIFHPQGGGQPTDIGVITNDAGAVFNVHMVRTSTDMQGVVLHFGRFKDAAVAFEAGDKVTQTIDAELRNLHSRYHTAGHVLGAAVRHLVESHVENFDETKASHFPDAASCEFQGLIEGKWKDPVQAKVDEYIAKDMPVEIDWWDEEDFKARGLERLIPDRKVMGMTETEKFRVVKIVGAEVYPCGGTHVQTTQLCGHTTVKKISRSKGTSRISYTLP